MRAVELFAGVGGFRIGLERAGHTVVFANEYDKYACDTYDKNFSNKGELIDRRDVTTIPATDIPDHDIICGGFPCQSFSIAGKRKGFDETRGTLFFDIMRIARHHRTPYLFLENVKGLLNHDGGRTFEVILETLDESGYDCQWQVLNSKNFGVPQNRERIIIIGHLRGFPRPQVFPLGQDGGECNEVVERQAQVTGTINVSMHKGGNKQDANNHLLIKQLNQPKHSNDRVYGTDGISPTLNTMQGGMRQPFVAMTETRTEEAKAIRRATKDRDFSPRRGKVLVPRSDDIGNTVTATQGKEQLLISKTIRVGGGKSPHGSKQNWDSYEIGGRIRRLTPMECERLQGFPDNWTEGVSDSQRYKQMGNAVTTNVIEAVASRLPITVEGAVL